MKFAVKCVGSLIQPITSKAEQQLAVARLSASSLNIGQTRSNHDLQPVMKPTTSNVTRMDGFKINQNCLFFKFREKVVLP